MKNVVWMKVTHDKYELPVAVADSSRELAQICGVKLSSIYSIMSHAKNNYRNYDWSPYRKIRLEEDEEDE